MTRVLIIEDESVAAQQLRRLLSDADPQIEVIEVLQSIEESVEWFQSNPMPDLTFMDIHLADGSAFRIFDKADITCPIIFTTAYDQYALEAFRVNSIDYLLKPVSPADLRRALDKYAAFASPRVEPAGAPVPDLQGLIGMMMQQCRQYQSYFLIPTADRLKPLAVKDIAYIYLENKVAKAVTYEGKTFATDKTLDALMDQLDPTKFYRVNRQFVVAHAAICDISFWLLGKLKLNLTVSTPESVIVPKAKVPEFKEWYSR